MPPRSRQKDLSRAKGRSSGGGGRLGLLVVLLAVVVAGAAWLVLTPYGPATEQMVDIAPGTSSAEMATQLERSGVLRSALSFELLRLLLHRRLRAGEYRFDHPASAVEVYRRIAHGDIYMHTVVIPEGFNIFDIARTVEAAGLGSAGEVLAAERGETQLVADLLPPGAALPSLEGFLFPDTYRFAKHTAPKVMLGAMVRRFRQQSALLGLSPGEGLLRTVTLASLVEKEVAQPEERPLVASVFANRLRAGMPLQTDPTVIYAALLENRFRGTIYASDLRSQSAWNTYTHTGLPPGPICSPGALALKAAVAPPKTDYLYFVSDAAGHSVFSATLAEHNRNVAAYRKSVAGEGVTTP